MKIEVKFDAERFKRALGQTTMSVFHAEVAQRQRRVASLRCREHGRVANVSRRGNKYVVSACCETFAAEVRRLLSAA